MPTGCPLPAAFNLHDKVSFPEPHLMYPPYICSSPSHGCHSFSTPCTPSTGHCLFPRYHPHWHDSHLVSKLAIFMGTGDALPASLHLSNFIYFQTSSEGMAFCPGLNGLPFLCCCFYQPQYGVYKPHTKAETGERLEQYWARKTPPLRHCTEHAPGESSSKK